MNIGQALKRLRTEKGLKQMVFADQIGITQTYLSQIENEKKKPSLEVIEKIADAVGVPLPVLFWFSIERNDVSEGKKYVYDMLKPSVDGLMSEIFIYS